MFELAQQWFVIPGCKLTVIADGVTKSIGYDSLKDALSATVQALPVGRPSMGEPADIEIREKVIGDVTVSYAVKWSPYFKKWSFLQLFDPERLPPEIRASLRLGICVEGVRVVDPTPGFRQNRIVAIANASGPGSPRTNVARSTLEDTSEYRNLLKSVYQAYVDHVAEEALAMHEERGYSLTGAITESSYLLTELLRDSRNLASPALFKEALKLIPTEIIEIDGARHLLPISRLDRYEELRSVQDDLLDKAESLLRQLPASMSLKQLITSIEPLAVDLPTKPLRVYNYGPELVREIFDDEWAISEFKVDVNMPRIEVSWLRDPGPTGRRWTTASLAQTPRRRMTDSFLGYDDMDNSLAGFLDHGFPMNVRFAVEPIVCDGLDRYDGIVFRGGLYMLPDRSWQQVADVLCRTTDLRNASSTDISIMADITAYIAGTDPSSVDARALEETINRIMIQEDRRGRTRATIELIQAIRSSSWRIFDPRDWKRREG
jgi:molecular chaperone HtpG